MQVATTMPEANPGSRRWRWRDVSATPEVTGSPVRNRVTSIDFVRGVAMILMAIDHVRVYSGIPAGGPTFGLFFTRWITHFVAPTFVFLAWISTDNS